MQRLPEHLKRPLIDTEKTKTVRRILKTKCFLRNNSKFRVPTQKGLELFLYKIIKQNNYK